ncbi:MAG: hypothetical protein ABSD61_09045, partial [Terracidiphilus sp.]
VLVSAMGYGADYKYFFSRNALDDFDWSQSLATLIDLARNCLLVDRVLCPVSLVILVLALTWKRKLWSNALFTASWLALAGQASFIFRLQDDYAPRYFLVMLVPVILIAALTLDEVLAPSKATPTPPNPEAGVSAPVPPSEGRNSNRILARPNPFWNLPSAKLFAVTRSKIK